MTFSFAEIARRRTLCCLGLGAFVLVARAALLPVWPIPVPSIYDEFSYLLQADTFAHGRLANPTHPLWPFFESIYILQQPTYASRYPPGQGLAMALGQTALGNPWFGVWLSCGILAAALAWALYAWLPPKWALAGAALGLQVCFFGYWMNSYWGGAVTATGGALVIGAWRRITHRGDSRQAWTLGAGAVVLMLTRPFEGGLLLIPVLAALRGQALRGRSGKVWLPILVCGAVGAAWLGYDNYRVTGHALRLPYTEYFAQYETVPPLSVLPLAPATSRTFRHFDLEWLDKGYALDLWKKARTWSFIPKRAHDWYMVLKTILGSSLAIVPLLLFAPRLFRSRRTRFLMCLAAVAVAGSLVEVGYFPHYAAPFAAVFLILAAQSIRSLRSYAPAVLGMIFVYVLWSDASQIYGHRTPDRFLAVNSRKGRIEENLALRSPGRHVIFVRYTGAQSPHEEWIYNKADIDASPVVWAQDMGDDENRRLMQYFAGRAFWRFQPDESPDTPTPYR